MEKAELVQETKHYVKCPYCQGSQNSVDHLFGRDTSFGPWYCDACGKAYRGEVKGKEIFIEKRPDQWCKNTLVFLRKEDILLVVKGRAFNGSMDGDPYYYEEHTCPVNYLRESVMVIDIPNQDKDPHGLFDYLGTDVTLEGEDMASIDEEKIFERAMSLLSKDPQGGVTLKVRPPVPLEFHPEQETPGAKE